MSQKKPPVQEAFDFFLAAQRNQFPTSFIHCGNGLGSRQPSARERLSHAKVGRQHTLEYQMEKVTISNEKEYKAALREVEPYFDNEPAIGSSEAERFVLLLEAIEAYEDIHYRIDPPDSPSHSEKK
ncbi:hypothetical protein [Herbaspirillum sp. RV1423]|uniref:hypothetical protein n=1 Tax=Herbaspirillum sp. RV1423 TaxID=1443993 RepID=UPI0012DE3008|nr:hypothetical protein [Herbaspirillum sp. RV1423]